MRPSATLVDGLGVPRRSCDTGSARTRPPAVRRSCAPPGGYKALGATEPAEVPGWQGAGHLMGTHRMGTDPSASCADRFGRTHEHPNLYLAGAGLFPTVDAANPTLTIAAMALRTADHLVHELRTLPAPEPARERNL